MVSVSCKYMWGDQTLSVAKDTASILHILLCACAGNIICRVDILTTVVTGKGY